MKNERLMKKVKKHWRQLRLRLKLRMKAGISDADSPDKNNFLKNAIKNEDEENEDNEDDGPKT